MVFSTNTIAESLNRPFPTIEDSDDDNFSLFESTLENIIEEDKQFNAMMCRYIAEGTTSILKNVFDLGSLIARILEAFVRAIENIASNFKIFLSKFLNAGTRLNVYKSKLANFRGRVHYDKDYYEFRNLDMDTSYSMYGTELEKEYRELMNSLFSLRSSRTNTDIMSELQNMQDESEYREEDMDELRGKVLGLHKSVSKDEFDTEIFIYFRYDTAPIEPDLSSKYEKNIDGDRVHEAFKAYFDSHKQESIVRRDKAKLTDEANKQKRMIRDTKLEDFVNKEMLNGEMKNIFHSIIVNKCRKVKEICSIYTLLFNGKLLALKDYNMTNRGILLAAINEIIRNE